MINGLDMAYHNRIRHTCSGHLTNNDLQSYHCIIIKGMTDTVIGNPVPAGADDYPHMLPLG